MTRATPRLRITDGERYPVRVTGPDEAEKERRRALWNAARELAGGDARRLQKEADGSITILEEPRRIFLVRLRGSTWSFKNPQKKHLDLSKLGPPKFDLATSID